MKHFFFNFFIIIILNYRSAVSLVWIVFFLRKTDENQTRKSIKNSFIGRNHWKSDVFWFAKKAKEKITWDLYPNPTCPNLWALKKVGNNAHSFHWAYGVKCVSNRINGWKLNIVFKVGNFYYCTRNTVLSQHTTIHIFPILEFTELKTRRAASDILQGMVFHSRCKKLARVWKTILSFQISGMQCSIIFAWLWKFLLGWVLLYQSFLFQRQNSVLKIVM